MMRQFLLAFGLLSTVIACKKTGDDQADASTPGGTTYSLQWGPVTIPMDTENTQCVVLNLGNAAPIKVHEIHNMLSTGSHHMIVYKDDDPAATVQSAPVNCVPFVGALNTNGTIEPLAITQKLDDDIVLPDGVAYTFEPNQMIKIELHYINTSDASEPIMGTVGFVAADPSTIQNEAGLLFTGSPDIDVKANMTTTLTEFFAVPPEIDLSQSHIFAITGHEHHLGTNVEVGVGPGSAGPFTPVYTPTNFLWSEPPTQEQSPDFAVPTGGGFNFTCTWNNGTNSDVKFGESACDEMCFFWAYYWPASGSEVCIHTDQSNQANVHDICCPSSNALCALLPALLANDMGSASTPNCTQ